jgi:EmrB/QacA subfamily drug resistance transporter
MAARTRVVGVQASDASRASARGTLAVACLATAMLMLDIAVVNTALSHIAADLHSSLTGLQWIIDAYTLTLATIVLSAGSLADRIGRRRVFAWGIALFTASSLVCALAGSILVLDLARAVQGIGGALMFATSLALISSTFQFPADRAKAFAAYGATIGAAFAIGPLVGGLLTSGISWRAVFFVNVPLGLFALAATRVWVHESRDPHPRRLDWPGQATLCASLFLLVLALLRGNVNGWGSAPIVAELAGGTALLALFLLIQARSRAPMLPLGFFRRPAFAGAQVAAFAISASFFAIYLYLTLYLQEVLHLSAVETGLVYLPGTILLFVVSGASAPLVQRTSPGLMIVAGLVLVAAGTALMTIVTPTSSWALVLPGEMTASLGTGLFNPALSAVALSALPERHGGLAAGVNDTFRNSGVAIGTALFGALVPAAAAVGHGSGASYVNGLHHAVLLAAFIAAAGALATARLIGLRRSHQALAPAEQAPVDTRGYAGTEPA